MSRRRAPWLWPTVSTINSTSALSWIVLLYLGFWGPSLVRTVHWWTTHSLDASGAWRIVAISTQCAGDLLLIGVARTAMFARHRGRCCWWTWVAASFVLVLGRALFIGIPDGPWHYLAASMSMVAASGLLLLASIVLVGPLAPRAARPCRDTWVSLEVYFFAFLALQLGADLQAVFQWLPYTTKDYPMPVHPSTAYVVNQLVSDALAGPTEEVFFCLLLVTLLRQAGSRWSTVACWCVGLRLLFHLYYGPPALFLMVWAALTLAIYRSTGRWIAVAIMHSVNDMLATVHLAPLQAVPWGVIGLVLLVVRWSSLRSHRGVLPFWVGPTPHRARPVARTGDSPMTP